MDIFSVLALVGGLALFLYGMDKMGEGLKKLSGSSLERILGKLTSNNFTGFLLGFVVTAIIQSSSATTVMVVGFVNSGIMKLSQSISVIMGANIGTTVTSWLLSTTGISGTSMLLKFLKPESFTPILMIAGVIITMVSASEKKKNFAEILIGFSVLIFGMEMMSDSVSGLKDNPSFHNILLMFSNPVMGIVMGTVLTAIIQSSSASIGILQALAFTGAIPFSTAIPIILGMNIGTTITPILSSINGNTDAKRVAISCLYIKMIGVIVVSVAFYAWNAIAPFSFMSLSVSAFTIAIVHTLFNILSTVILLPLCKPLEKLAIMTVRTKKEETTDSFDTLDDRFLTLPTFAVEKCRELVCEMMIRTRDSFFEAADLLSDFNKDVPKKIVESERLVDKYEDKIGSYLVKIAGSEIGENESQEVTQLLHVIGDIERISDHSVNVMEAAEEMHTKGISFSEQAKKELSVFISAVNEILAIATDTLIGKDVESAIKVEPLEQVIDTLRTSIKDNHIKRLQDGNCTMELGFVLSDILTNFERVSDHCSNIAACVLNIADHSFETHKYLKHVKKDGENEYFSQLEDYKKKYAL